MASITLVQKNKSKGIRTWYARVPDSRGVHFYSLGTTNKTEAKAVLQERIREGAYDARDERSTMTLGEAATRFEGYQRAKGSKSSSIDTILQAVNMLEPLFGCVVSELATKDISDTFMAAAESLSPTTYRNRKTILSTFFKYVVEVLELIPGNPVPKAIPRRKMVKPVRFFWTREQIDRILAESPTPHHRLLYSFMAFAGLRVSEALAMTPEKIYGKEIHVVGKGDKFATIPVSPRLQREIDRCPPPWDFHYNRATLKKVCSRAIPEGFPGVAHAHRFRHSFGSNLIREGVNIKVVQTLMRHENIQLTLDIYGHLLDTDPKDALEKVFA
ncbi:MAG: site-specific integrase [Fibrobacter sp.]|nr:site-specific integrase [Fibrobacter sp.]